MRYFTAKSHTLLTLLLLVNVLIYSAINVFIAVWIGGKVPNFAR